MGHSGNGKSLGLLRLTELLPMWSFNPRNVPIEQWERSLSIGHVPLEQHGRRILSNIQLDIQLDIV